MTITIITATYNRSALLPLLFQSLVGQNYDSLEWIIVNDGGSDNTGEVVEQFHRQASFVIRYVTQQNRGKNFAVNRALDMVSGDLVAIVDDDDVLLPNVLSFVAEDYAAIAQDRAIVGLSYLTVNHKGKVWGRRFSQDRCVSDHYQCRINEGIWGDKLEFTRSAVFQNPAVRYFASNESRGFGGDTIFFLKIADQGKTLYINRPVLEKNYLADGLSVNWRRQSLSAPILTANYYACHTGKQLRFWIRLRYMVGLWAIATYSPVPEILGLVAKSGNWFIRLLAYLPGKFIGIRWRKYRQGSAPTASKWLKKDS